MRRFRIIYEMLQLYWFRNTFNFISMCDFNGYVYVYGYYIL